MIAAQSALVDRLSNAYRNGNTLVLLFDFDGTLAPLCEHPSLAALDPNTERLLVRLSRLPRVALGVLSGRSLGDLKSLVRLPRCYLAGTGGMEMDLCGTRFEHHEADRAAELMRRLAAQLEKEVACHRGAWIEQKRLGVTVHYRHLPEQQVAPLWEFVEATVSDFIGELRIVGGPKAWEITPAWGWTKGTAVRLILAHLGARTEALLYVGDGPNDAEAMEVVAAAGGIALGIGTDPPVASQYRLPNQAAIQPFLARLDAALEYQLATVRWHVENRECLLGAPQWLKS